MPKVSFGKGEIDAAKPLPQDWYRFVVKEYNVKRAKSGTSNNHFFKGHLPGKDNRPFTFMINDTNPEYGLIQLCSALLGRPLEPEEEVDLDASVGREIEIFITDQMNQETQQMRQVASQYRPLKSAA